MFFHCKINQGFWDLYIILSKGLVFCLFCFVCFLAMPHNMWHLSSLTGMEPELHGSQESPQKMF